MIKSLQVLSILFVVQAVLIGVVQLTSGPSSSDSSTSEPYLAVDFDNVDKILIKGRNSLATLQKSGGKWRLPEYGNLEVSDNTWNTMFDKLQAMKNSWPVATTEGAAKRFEVDDENAKKRIEFYEGDKLVQTLFLGTSPGHRKVHARLDDGNEIQTVEISQYEASAADKEWFNKGLLKATGDITEITNGEFTLKLSDEKWIVTPSETNQIEKAADIKAWVDRFGTFVVSMLVNDETKEKEILALTPESNLTVKTNTGDVTYTFYKQEEKFYVKSSLHEKLFEVAKYQAEKLATADVSKFLETTEVATEVPAETSGAETQAIDETNNSDESLADKS